MSLHESMTGVWWLVSREDRTRDQQKRIDPVLGPDPVAILAYSTTHFTAQFMKRNRDEADKEFKTAGANNTAAVGGYDAYFGTYRVEDNGTVSHTLLGSINSANIGITVSRNLTIENGQLSIRLDTTTPDGEHITRTLIWKKLS